MQESKYKRINTRALFGEFKIGLENLELTENGLSLSRRELYKPGDDILDDPDLDLRDLDTDDCDTLYVIDRKSSSILTYHRDFKKLQFPAYKTGALAYLIDDPEGIAVDENSVYVIGKLRVPLGGRKEGLVALGKKDLKVLWTVLKGPEGFSLKDLKDLAMDSAGNLYVLEKSRNRVLKISFSSNERFFVEISRGELFDPKNIYIDIEGMLNVLDGISGYLVFRTDRTIEKREITSSTKGMVRRRRAHDSKKNLYMISETKKRVRFLEYIEENSPDSEGVFKGTYLSKPIDSKTQKTRWYRFLLEGSFPRGTKVEFHYHISDELLKENELRELPDSEWEDGLPGSSSIQGEEKRDALFMTEREGRYLWFRIILTGTEKLSPVISSVTIFFPKVSYLDYLPSVYRENSANRDFLDRFLAIFESLLFEIDFTIDHLSSWFDAAGTPPEFLEWLGSWIGVDRGRGESAALKKVPEAKRREFISRAVSLYRERGTREGLENFIFFYTGKKPIIIENLPVSCKGEKTRNESRKEAINPEGRKFLYFPPEVSLHDSLFGGEKFSFVVLFKEKLEEAELELIRSIIEEEKPAYTTYKIKVLEPWFCLDGHTYLGENTVLKRPEFLLGKSSVLGRDTALGVENSPDVTRMIPDRNYAHSIGHSTDR
jgi:phage tail-like protein